ncbi:MAG: nuclear transport factor 2 family protein [Solirubrobacterales bacterium]|nr:nuclear transport factor 2 family protein [Solirubrobacterales bacterium]
MSQENVEIVQAIYDGWQRGDLEASFRHIAEEAEFIAPPDLTGGGRSFRGQDGFSESLTEWIGGWDHYHFELSGLIDCEGELVLAEGRQRGRGKSSGVEVDEPIYGLWTLKDGQAVQHRVFRNRSQALEAAGLSE